VAEAKGNESKDHLGYTERPCHKPMNQPTKQTIPRGRVELSIITKNKYSGKIIKERIVKI
jgi:hypothetical protein